MRKYSRLFSIEERRHRRKAFVYAFLSLSLFLAFIFYGLPTVAKLSASLSDLRPKTPDNAENNPPAKPRFLTQNVATNSATLTITGVDQAGVEVIIFRDGKDLGTVKTNEIGSFEKEITLREGVNKFSARAKNDKGLESQNSDSLEIILDTNPPEITITEPVEQVATTEKITIAGEVSEEAEIYVNDKIAVLGDQNTFSQTVNLLQGENKVTIKAVDKAGNQSTNELIFTRT